jgi:hemerythrin superfamily protein
MPTKSTFTKSKSKSSQSKSSSAKSAKSSNSKSTDHKASDTQDAIELLKADHKEVKSAFEQFEELGDEAYEEKKELADQICNALIVHTTIEEEIFYPAVREAIKDGDDMIDEAVVEHAGAKELIEQILQMSADEDLFDAKVKVLSEQIDHHVKEEEGELFPKVRKSDLDLEALGEELAARKAELAEAIPLEGKPAESPRMRY